MTIKSERNLPGGNEPKTSNRTIEKLITNDKESFVICKTSNYRLNEEFENNYYE